MTTSVVLTLPPSKEHEIQARHDAIRTALDQLGKVDEVALSLPVLLDALGWQGEARAVAEALPHFADRLTFDRLCNVMALLGYVSTRLEVNRLADVDHRLLPCLFEGVNGEVFVLLSGKTTLPGLWRVHDVAQGRDIDIDPRRYGGMVYFFSSRENHQELADAAASGQWLSLVLARFRPVLAQVAIYTFFIYMLAIVPPLFTMTIYDRIIPSKSYLSLLALLSGAILAVCAEVWLRERRGHMLAHIGVRLNLLVSGSMMNQMMKLPLLATERSKLGAQIMRLRNAEFVRDTFSGHTAMTMLDLPFSIIFIITLALLGGWLAVVPLIAAVLYVLIALLMAPMISRNTALSSKLTSQRQEFAIETITKMRALRTLSITDVWLNRYRELSGAAAMAGYKSALLNAIISTLGYGIMVTAGVITIGMGALGIMNGTVTVGALIAIMTLTWRVLTPLQSGFTILNRLEQIRTGTRQVNQLMQARIEEQPDRNDGNTVPQLQGRGAFSRVSMRYANDLDPVLLGVSFDIKPGERIAVIGPNGAGKSTLLKTILGIYQPQAGTIRIDDIDLRQRDPINLRKAIGYVPQDFSLFYGTIAQNLRLADPTASMSDLQEAARKAGVHELIEQLPEGYHHRVGDQRSAQLPAVLHAGLAIASAYLRKPGILLFDEAIDSLDSERETTLMQTLDALRGKTTVFMVTHRPAHMRSADRLLVLQAGQLVLNDKPELVLPKLPPGFL